MRGVRGHRPTTLKAKSLAHLLGNAEPGNGKCWSLRRVRDPVVVPNLAAQAAFRNRHDDPVLMNIKPDIRDTIPQPVSYA
jgi:hypothetical protein